MGCSVLTALENSVKCGGCRQLRKPPTPPKIRLHKPTSLATVQGDPDDPEWVGYSEIAMLPGETLCSYGLLTVDQIDKNF